MDLSAPPTLVGPFAATTTPNVWILQLKQGDTVVEVYSFSALDSEVARRRAVDYLAFIHRKQWELIPGARLERQSVEVSPFPPKVTQLVQQLLAEARLPEPPPATSEPPTAG